MIADAGSDLAGISKLRGSLEKAGRDGSAVLLAAGIASDAPGLLSADTVNKAFTQELVTALGLHRNWDRAAAVMSSAVPPSV